MIRTMPLGLAAPHDQPAVVLPIHVGPRQGSNFTGTTEPGQPADLSFGASKPATHRRLKTGHRVGRTGWKNRFLRTYIQGVSVQFVPSVPVFRSAAASPPRNRRAFPVGALACFGPASASVGYRGDDRGEEGIWKIVKLSSRNDYDAVSVSLGSLVVSPVDEAMTSREKFRNQVENFHQGIVTRPSMIGAAGALQDSRVVDHGDAFFRVTDHRQLVVDHSLNDSEFLRQLAAVGLIGRFAEVDPQAKLVHGAPQFNGVTSMIGSIPKRLAYSSIFRNTSLCGGPSKWKYGSRPVSPELEVPLPVEDEPVPEPELLGSARPID